MMLTASTRVPTPNAKRYLRMLCKHFAHKVAVEYSETHGHCQLPPGPAILNADGSQLTVQVSAENDEGLRQAQYIISAHLLRFAHKEALAEPTWCEGEILAGDESAIKGDTE